MSARRHGLGRLAAAAVAILAAGGSASASPAESSVGAAQTADGGGTPGYCPSRQGVTVVVDFQELGGGIVVRCAPGPVGSGFTGLDALQQAGFDPAGTQRWGFAFICRIADKPAPDQKLHLDGDRRYQEACVDTPPVQAYWSYWYAPNAGAWTFSSAGPMSRDVIPGGFEGWSFSLNHAQDAAPPPGIDPVRPPHTPPTTPPPTHHPPTHPPPSSPPSSSPPPTHPTHGTGSPTPTAPPTSGSPSTTAPTTHHPHRAANSAPGPTATTSVATPQTTLDPVAAGHNAAGEQVSGTLPSEPSTSGGSARTALLGIGVVILLAGGAGFAAWRRRNGT